MASPMNVSVEKQIHVILNTVCAISITEQEVAAVNLYWRQPSSSEIGNVVSPRAFTSNIVLSVHVLLFSRLSQLCIKMGFHV